MQTKHVVGRGITTGFLLAVCLSCRVRGLRLWFRCGVGVAESLVGGVANTDNTPPLGWHVISGEDLLAMLRRVANGENPDMVYVEEWVNADHEKVDDL